MNGREGCMKTFMHPLKTFGLQIVVHRDAQSHGFGRVKGNIFGAVDDQLRMELLDTTRVIVVS
jgi:hypothetical protein